MQNKKNSMKNTIKTAFMLLAIIAISTSCKKETITLANTYDFDKVIASDCQMIEKMYGDYIFYEANALFEKSISALDNPAIVSMRTIFQIQDTVVVLDHLVGEVGNNPQITKSTTGMIGDIQIFIDQIPISFAEAWVLLLNSSLPTPTGNTMTFRNPLSPPFDEYPSYIFPTDGGQHIRVYSGDGKVEYFD